MREDIAASKTDAAEQDFVEKNNFIIFVDNEKAVRKLFDYLKKDVGQKAILSLFLCKLITKRLEEMVALEFVDVNVTTSFPFFFNIFQYNYAFTSSVLFI